MPPNDQADRLVVVGRCNHSSSRPCPLSMIKQTACKGVSRLPLVTHSGQLLRELPAPRTTILSVPSHPLRRDVAFDMQPNQGSSPISPVYNVDCKCDQLEPCRHDQCPSFRGALHGIYGPTHPATNSVSIWAYRQPLWAIGVEYRPRRSCHGGS